LPHAAQRTNLDFRLARDAEVISPIGVALALVREVVERTIVEPTPEDIVRIRRQAQDAVIAAGASADNVDVSVEIDPQRNLVRATASGSSELAQTSARGVLDPDELAAVAGRMLRIPISEIVREEATGALTIFVRQRVSRGRFGRVQTVRDTRVLDSAGIARLGLLDPQITRSTAAAASGDLAAALESATAFGDVGRALPDIYVLHGARIANFSGLADAAQVIALAKEELAGREPDAPVVILAAKKEA
ncbi:MAG: hydantoinase/oxoprolinase family protein, partial [Candidatus Eremiobacteraeota bacterium]|nr:hydantoinase/oxoprolinase family protein [Candidatus Eremiobacteraeota bacterium]